MVIFDLPRFNGDDDIHYWLHQCEYFFDVDNVPDHHQVMSAYFALDGEALSWHHRTFIENKSAEEGPLDWQIYAKAIISRFGSSCEESMVELINHDHPMENDSQEDSVEESLTELGLFSRQEKQEDLVAVESISNKHEEFKHKLELSDSEFSSSKELVLSCPEFPCLEFLDSDSQLQHLNSAKQCELHQLLKNYKDQFNGAKSNFSSCASSNTLSRPQFQTQDGAVNHASCSSKQLLSIGQVSSLEFYASTQDPFKKALFHVVIDPEFSFVVGKDSSDLMYDSSDKNEEAKQAMNESHNDVIKGKKDPSIEIGQQGHLQDDFLVKKNDWMQDLQENKYTELQINELRVSLNKKMPEEAMQDEFPNRKVEVHIPSKYDRKVGMAREDDAQAMKVILLHSEKMSWILDKLTESIEDESVLIFAYARVTVDKIERQLIQRSFEAKDFQSDKVINMLQKFLDDGLACATLKKFSGEMEMGSKKMNLNIFLFRAVEALRGVKSSIDERLLVKQNLMTRDFITFEETLTNLVETQWKNSGIFTREGAANTIFQWCPKQRCKEEYKTLFEMFGYIIWGWYYKDNGNSFGRFIEDFKIELIQNLQYEEHPGRWKREWKIAWVTIDFQANNSLRQSLLKRKFQSCSLESHPKFFVGTMQFGQGRLIYFLDPVGNYYSSTMNMNPFQFSSGKKYWDLGVNSEAYKHWKRWA